MPLAVLIVLGILHAWLVLFPSWPLGADAPPTAFSATRALRVVEAIARQPHPAGSRENLRVRDWLATELRRLGWEVDIESGLVFEGYKVSRAENIYAWRRGTDSRGVVMLSAHYDSVAFGPGAADNGAGVAALVETARALALTPALRNDIVICLSDSEEGGLHGAKSLLANASWAKDIAVIVNFDARGVRGPSLMFQARGGATLLKGFFRAVPHPVGSSAMAGVARLLPTRTEFRLYHEAGHRGFDFAFIRGLAYYHSENDSLANLDRGSLQHHGSHALGLARHFGNADLRALAEAGPELVYFNLFGHWIACYPAAWEGPLVGIVAGLTLIPLVTGLRRRLFGPARAARALVLLFAAVPLVVAMNLVAPLLGLVRFGPYAVYNQAWYVVGYLALTLGFLLPWLAWVLRQVGLPALVAAAGPGLGLVLLGLHRVFPSGAYLLLWPLLGLILAALVVVLRPPEPRANRAVTAGLAACALPTVLVLLPFLFLLFDAFTFAPGPTLMLLVWAAVVLMLPVLAAHLARLPRWSGAALLAVALVANAVAVFDQRFTPQRPRMVDLQYGLDRTTGQAWWMTTENPPAGWLAGFFSDPEPWNRADFLPHENTPMIRSPAPLSAEPAGEMRLVHLGERDGRRTWSLRVRPGSATSGFVLYTPAHARPLAVRVNGRPMPVSEPPSSPASWLMYYQGRCDDGLSLEFDYPTNSLTAPPVVCLTEWVPGFPAGLAVALADRPRWLIPRSNTFPSSNFSWEAVRRGRVSRLIRFGHNNWNHGTFIHDRLELDAARPAPPP